MHKDRRKEIICSVAAIVLLYGAFAFSGIGCPIKFVTGISCAGCGMSRAWLSVLRGDLRAAWNYHPLFWTIPPALAVWFIRQRLNKKMLNISLFIFAAIFVIVYVYRLLDPADEIVVFAPWEGVIARMLNSILNLLRS